MDYVRYRAHPPNRKETQMKDKHEKRPNPAEAASAPAQDAPSHEIERTSARSTRSSPKPEIRPLPEDASLRDVVMAVNALLDRGGAKRDRGPTSTRDMTPADADRVILGDLKDTSHAKAAEMLGLSYGQVYSARKGFTFKSEYQKGLKEQRTTNSKPS